MKEPTKKHSQFVNEFSKVTVYKASIQNLTVFLYSNNEKFKNEIKKVISFTE